MTKIRHITFREGQYAGVLVRGERRVELPNTNRHMDRAFWLTSQLESSKWGTVQSYDGAGISAGPVHNTAILPRNMRQGSLWRLLRYLEIAAGSSATRSLQVLWDELQLANLYVNRRGELRYYDRGGMVPARVIRNVFAPVEGVVPRSGPNWETARRWALRFHELFADPRTFHAQKEYAIEYLITGREREEEEAYGPNVDHAQAEVGDGRFQVPLELDLAMSVYHSHSVNGPRPALTCLQETLRLAKPDKPYVFAKTLLWHLGKNDYGRWKDDQRGRNRYDYSRIKAMRSGLWPEDLFDGPKAIMPENLLRHRPV